MEVSNQIEEVKNRTDIIGLVSGYVTLKKAGRNYRGLCPFHSEKTPSFMVSSERQIFKCFGCNEGGDVFAFYQKIEDTGFGEALKVLATRAGIILKDVRVDPKEKQREILFEINEKASEFYHYLLTQHQSGKKALDYLKNRQINLNSIKEWRLGFAPADWDSLTKFLTKKNFSPKELILAGVVVPSTKSRGFDRFRNRIMFPITNVSGAVIGFSGRIFGDGEPKYLNSPDSLIFNKSKNLFGLSYAKGEIKKQNQAILVEGNLDVLSSFQAGVTNVIAPLGTALTESQMELVRRFTETLVISFDNDLAGVAAAKRGIEMAENLGLNVRLLKLAGKDPDEIIKQNPEKWKQAVKNSVSVYDYLIDTALEKFGREPSAFGKITKEVLPFLAKIDNAITRSHYERYLARQLGVDEEAVKEELQKKVTTFVKEEKKEERKSSEKERLEEYLLTLIVQSKILPKEFNVREVQNESLRSLFEILEKNSEGKKINSKAAEKDLVGGLKEKFDELSLRELPEEIIKESQEIIEREINTCTLRIKELNLRTRLQNLSLAIKQAEIIKSPKVEDLSKEFKEISLQLSELERAREN